jgi:hypothetical protein
MGGLLSGKVSLYSYVAMTNDKIFSEETIIVNRVIREDPTKSGMHNRQPLTPKLLWKSMCDYDLWPLYIIGLTFQIPETTPSSYLTLTLKGLGFGTFNTNLLVIPSTVFHMITMLALAYFAEVNGELSLTSMLGQIWAFPFLIYIYCVDITKINKWKSFGIMSLLLSYPSGMNPSTSQHGLTFMLSSSHILIFL